MIKELIHQMYASETELIRYYTIKCWMYANMDWNQLVRK